MSRRQQPPLLPVIFDLLKVAPFWVGPILAVIVFVLFRFVSPAFIPAPKGGVDFGPLMRPMFSIFAWAFAIAVLVLSLFAQIWKLMKRHLVDSQTGLESIKSISWREFERLVGEAYRRKGYVAEVVGSDSGDGGVDIRLTGHGETVLVQCKQWRAYKVSVTTVRELLGVVVSQRADRGIVVTSGRFTQEAQDFARQNPQIELVDGRELTALIRGVQVGASISPPPTPVSGSAAPRCPLCGSEMVLRTARKGQNAGSQFWGCSQFSTAGCRGKRQMNGGSAWRASRM